MDGDCKVLATAIIAMVRRVARSSERFSSKESCGTVGPGLDVDWCTITGLFGISVNVTRLSKGFEDNRVQMGSYMHMKLWAMGRTSRGHSSK